MKPAEAKAEIARLQREVVNLKATIAAMWHTAKEMEFRPPFKTFVMIKDGQFHAVPPDKVEKFYESLAEHWAEAGGRFVFEFEEYEREISRLKARRGKSR
jgi:hypothetical protein